ncbi:glycosyltransferase family 2 protein [Oceanobacillus sp. APA_J-5(13-2)]|nr:glycosyltransferase family 2 protein [Oceanobacillus alkalisoli]MCF3944056.1 glycosyltransferase family 2 protein [Oceanobacillus alkalisoli]MCG5103328.1 glycosyltransferase family 2 protein [Oceanobacillus alkalisoli]
MKGLITLLLPAYNESENIDYLYDELMKITKQLPYLVEFLFIDDGSKDNTLEKVKNLARFSNHVKYISFSRNFGKEAAIYAGLQHAKGEAVILMDTDLQHPPSLIPELVRGYEAGYHQVITKRDRRGETRFHKFMTSTFYRLMNKVSDVNLNDGEGDFRLLSRKAVDALLQLSEGNRFSKGLYSWIGLSQKTITYQNVQRESGKSKWSFSSLITYALDGILSFNTKPLRLCFYLGTVSLFLSFIYVLYMFISIIINGINVPGYFTIISSVLFLGGVQLLSIGIIGEYIGRIYNETKKRPHYIVNESNATELKTEVTAYPYPSKIYPQGTTRTEKKEKVGF